MLERERQRLILKAVEEQSVIAVGDLCDLLGASEATVRRDIVALAERGELRRVRGGVEALQPRFRPHLVGTPLALSRDIQAAEKRAIARAAASLVGDGDSIVVGAGSTTFCLAEFLEHKELDILTSSFPLAAHLVSHSRSRVTLPGGTIYREQSVVLSPFTGETSHFAGRLFLTSCFGINHRGMMENDPLIVQSQSRLLDSADELVVLADSRKLRQRSSMLVAPLGRISRVITDSAAAAEDLDALRQAGVEVSVVAVAGSAGGGDRSIEDVA